MKQKLSNRNLVLAVFIFGAMQVFGQTKEQKELIRSNYDQLKLTELQSNFYQQFEVQKQAALDYATQKGIQMKVQLKDGGYAELQRIDPDGSLIYYRTCNVAAARSTRTNHLNTGGSTGYNLNGDNMTAHVWDGGLARATHQEYDGPGGNDRFSIGDGTTVLHYHSAHVTGTIIASGVVANAKGMAPHASAIGYDWNYDLAEATASAGNGMLISNHSYGFNSQYVPDYYFGAYITESSNWDELMYNAPYYLMVKAAGNDGTTKYNSLPLSPSLKQYDKLTGAATSKNNLVVASCQDASIDNDGNLLSVAISTFSSQGPTDDLRIKPDITGNGQGVYSTYETSNTVYNSISGTSMAAPNVAGSLLLLQQHAFQVTGNYMKSSTLKGLVLHTADDAGMVGPDAIWGWGLMNAKSAAQTISKNGTEAIISELTLSQGQTYVIEVQSDGINKLIASICWTDPAGVATTTANSSIARLVNDLDIRVIKGGTTYFPWRLTGVSTNGLGDNIKDPFERIEVANASGTYTIVISHKGTLTGGSQDYSLILTGITLAPQICVATVPTGLSGSAITHTTADISWNTVPLATYEISYRQTDATDWTNVTSALASLQITGLTPSTQYDVRVRSICPDNSVSDFSATEYFTTLAPPDTEAPTAPTNLTASGITEYTVNLSWTASTDNVGVTGYNVYSGTSKIKSVSSTSTTITELLPNTTYTFTVTAFDAANNESAASNAVVVTTLPVAITYCASKGTSSSLEFINRVQLGTINNLSGNNGGYADFTNLSASLNTGSSYTITITPGWSGSARREAYRVWIDYNQNGSFTDAGEQVVNVNRTTSTQVSGSFVVPVSALNGPTRMRVSMKYNASPLPCEVFTNGEVEDYTVVISNIGGSDYQLQMISETSSENLYIYPNPVTDDIINIYFDGENANSIRIFNILGQQVASMHYAETIDVSALQNGMYILEIRTDKTTVVSRFIKE
jgi:trimeric autotransporter adhesin